MELTSETVRTAGQRLLLVAGVGSFAIAILHIFVIFVGAPAYRYFGAGEEFADLDEAGSLTPTLITAGIVLVFFVFGLFALSGAKRIKKLPLLKVGLVIITGIYILRGAGVFIEVVGIIYGYEVPVRHAVFSFVAFALGVVHLLGVVKSWKGL